MRRDILGPVRRRWNALVEWSDGVDPYDPHVFLKMMGLAVTLGIVAALIVGTVGFR